MSNQMDIEKPTLFTKEIDDLLEKEKIARQNNDNTKMIELLPKIVNLSRFRTLP